MVLLGAGCLVVAACSGGGTASAPTEAPTAAAATAGPTPTRAAPPATATPAPQATATAEAAPASGTSETTVWVGNTDSEGVYLRKTPAMADRLQAYADGTPLTIIGDDVDGDGQHWHHVRAPDGTEGYVPAMYTVDTQP